MAKCVPDADAGATTTDPTKKDTDGGSKTDGLEDTNHNGQVDAGETDPNDPADDLPECTKDADCGVLVSGRVCDQEKCVDGCRGVDGNGCGYGEVCSSTDSTIGNCSLVPVECHVDSDCGGPQSGRACDLDAHVCVDGCRGAGGNVCPEGRFCSTETSELGACLPTPTLSVGGTGLSCGVSRAVSSSSGTGTFWGLGLALGVMLVRGRRKTRNVFPR